MANFFSSIGDFPGEPVEQRDVATSAAAAAETLISMSIAIMAITLYFVRQRDRFQQHSDDLLHSILPEAIATRFKTDTSMLAQDFPDTSVLFADVVGFTPWWAGMTPPELVGLVNSVFTKFDEFVTELGLEMGSCVDAAPRQSCNASSMALHSRRKGAIVTDCPAGPSASKRALAYPEV